MKAPSRIAFATALLVVLSVLPVDAIVVRHDRDDQAYLDLGKRYPEAVSVLPDGSGVLIAPQWVLTAAHVARGVSNRNPRVEISGREIDVSWVVLHPEWKDMGPHDIALLKLEQPVTDVKPAQLYAGDDEVGKIVTFVGRGDFGTGLTGPKTMDRKKRGATNRVDNADRDWLYFTFDEGEAATELEGVSGPGDSGGPALLAIDDTTYTLGVSVFADGKGKGPGRYGVLEGYTRVSTHRRWIEKALAGKLQDQGFAPGEASGRVMTRTMPMGKGGAELPDSPAGKIVAAYIDAYNSNDDATMTRFIADHFSDSYNDARTQADHLALYRRLRDELFGRLSITRIREVADDAITVLFDGATGSMAEIRFEIVGEQEPRIDGMRIAEVQVSMR